MDCSPKQTGYRARSFARMVAFQILYQEDANPGAADAFGDDFICQELNQLGTPSEPAGHQDVPDGEPVGEPVRDEPVNDELPVLTPLSTAELEQLVRFTRLLVRNVRQNAEAIDATITATARNWTLERMGAAERNILRLAVGELAFTQTPRAIVINEALELTKKFGGPDSTSFINGILDRAVLPEKTPLPEKETLEDRE